MNISDPILPFQTTPGSCRQKSRTPDPEPLVQRSRGTFTVVEVPLLIHHEGLDFRAVISAEGKRSGVLRPELVLPGTSEIDGVHQGQPGHAVEVVSGEQSTNLTCKEHVWVKRILTVRKCDQTTIICSLLKNVAIKTYCTDAFILPIISTFLR